MSTIRRALLLGALLLSLAAGAPVAGQTPGPRASADSVAVTFVANEGFILAHDSTKVAVDALFGSAERPYAVFPTPAMVADMEAARPPFDGIDLVLTTHPHDDHFLARNVAALLAREPGAVFLSTGPAVAAVIALDSGLARRASAVTPAQMHTLRSVRAGAVQVDARWVDHGRPDFENLAFALRWNGVSVLHTGDSFLARYRDYAWDRAGFDVAFVNARFLEDDPEGGVKLLRDVIGARSIVFMHHDPGEAAALEALAARLRPSFPNGVVIVPTALMQSFGVPVGRGARS